MKNIKNRIIEVLLRLLMISMRIFPIQNNKVVFSNFVGKGFGGNPKYIYLKLSEQVSIDAVWLVSNLHENNNLPDNVRAVKYHSLRKFYELATAKVWIDNCRKGEYMVKRSSQYYVMTWHGGIGIKKVENDAAVLLGKEYVRYAKIDSERIDLMISNSAWCTKLYNKSFWYSGEIIEEGLPRLDCLVNLTVYSGIKKLFGIPDSTRIIMYAPTFRKEKSLKPYKIAPDLVVNELANKFGGEWVFMYRLHPSISIKINIPECICQVIDVSTYNDIYQLLTVTDVVITDYSSIIFDFAETNKPAFLYVTDLEEYNKDRSTYFDIKALPFPFSDSNAQLVKNIRAFDMDEYKKELDSFFSKLGLNETGHAAESIANKIIEHMSSKEE